MHGFKVGRSFSVEVNSTLSCALSGGGGDANEFSNKSARRRVGKYDCLRSSLRAYISRYAQRRTPYPAV